ncbi:hypothetical protein F511_31961 [Dorcoceras hygrometricum]|uniref:CCHC-type domain-containing protein n=1 Tax=Dorcoceras hygrometricum TaxID=472368 RepID=A0A2Z7D5Q1_9LAMI|nr:hypothetical protein F511_31961 [Dorcoceras hygrometricum]
MSQQQPSHKIFKLRGKNFKKKSSSSSSGSDSSGRGSSMTVFCGQCGGKHMTSQCTGIEGACRLCGQHGHFERVCSSARSQYSSPQQQAHSLRRAQRMHRVDPVPSDVVAWMDGVLGSIYRGLVQISPAGHIFPVVDKSTEKVRAWLYFVSFAFIASAGFVDFEHMCTVQHQLVDLMASALSHLVYHTQQVASLSWFLSRFPSKLVASYRSLSSCLRLHVITGVDIVRAR